MERSSSPSEKLDFKRILPILVIIFVDLLGLSVIIPQLPLYTAHFSAAPLAVGILQATYPFMQFIGAPVPFRAGGLLLSTLALISPWSISNSQRDIPKVTVT